MNSPAVKDIRDLDGAIAEDQARIEEITRTIASNQRKRSAYLAALTPEEAAELNPPAAPVVAEPAAEPAA
jgi:hypothetical protein